jgi:hypothetical protein
VSRSASLAHRELAIGGAIDPEAGHCADGVDNDRDGWTDCGDPSCFFVLPCGREDCADRIDNDEDGRTDCDDGDCARSEACREVCSDGADNDRDGWTDCRDAECAGRDPCPSGELCGNGADNDEDGRIDCDDRACGLHPACRAPEDCDDGADNDEDGRTDCDDPDCIGVRRCRLFERCEDGADNDKDGRIDCDDPDCSALSTCRSFVERCDDGVDNDLDGRLDCEDPECGGRRPCPLAEICDNGIDDDRDGRTDCDDPGCETLRPCGPDGQGFDLVIFAEGAHREFGQPGPAGASEHNVVEVRPSPQTSIDAVTYLVPYPGPQARGVQGWSISIVHDDEVLDLLEFPADPLEGTEAGRLRESGFEFTQVITTPAGPKPPPGFSDEDPGLVQPGDVGYISSVTLSFTLPITLDPALPQSISRARYRVLPRLGAQGFETGFVRFRNGLRGTGEPFPNNLTVQGQSRRPLHFISLEIRPRDLGASFVRGDPNEDGCVNLADVVWIVNELVRGGPPTPCARAADANSDGRRDLSDAIYLARYLFVGGPVVAPPFPECDADESESPLDCGDSRCADGTGLARRG